MTNKEELIEHVTALFYLYGITNNKANVTNRVIIASALERAKEFVDLYESLRSEQN